MTAAELLQRLDGLGIVLWVDGDRLPYDGPSAVMTEELLVLLRTHKRALVGLLGESAGVSRPEHVPDRPNDLLGHVLELIRRGGNWRWRHRPEDKADRALAAVYGGRFGL